MSQRCSSAPVSLQASSQDEVFRVNFPHSDSDSSLRLRVVASVSDPGATHNEDLIVEGHDWAWVFDGATSLGETRWTGEPSDATWLVDQVSRALHASQAETLEGQLRFAADHLRASFVVHSGGQSLEADEAPSAVGAGVRLDQHTLHTIRFGDCSLIIEQGPGSALFVSSPSPLATLDASVMGKVHRLVSERNLTLDQARGEVLGQLRTNRRLMNRDGGYGALSVFGELPVIEEQVEFEVEAGATGLIASDGFMALVHDYGDTDDEGILQQARTEGLEELIRRLREIENADVEGRRFPRFKTHDDATALLFEVVS